MEKELRELHEKIDFIIELLEKIYSHKNSVGIVNQLDPKLFEDYLKTSNGEKVIINTIKRNKGKIKNGLDNG